MALEQAARDSSSIPLYESVSTAIRLHPRLHGLFPGLKKCPPDTFLRRQSRRRPLRVLHLNTIPNKKHHPAGWCFLFGGRYRTRTYDLPHVKRRHHARREVFTAGGKRSSRMPVTALCIVFISGCVYKAVVLMSV